MWNWACYIFVNESCNLSVTIFLNCGCSHNMKTAVWIFRSFQLKLSLAIIVKYFSNRMHTTHQYCSTKNDLVFNIHMPSHSDRVSFQLVTSFFHGNVLHILIGKIYSKLPCNDLRKSKPIDFCRSKCAKKYINIKISIFCHCVWPHVWDVWSCTPNILKDVINYNCLFLLMWYVVLEYNCE